MSCPHLPPELFDHIIDLLHGEHGTLKSCYLVSKSWVPRVRKNLFSKVTFASLDDFVAWNKIFPDPVSSPAHYARSLHIIGVEVILAAFFEEKNWVWTFSNVVRLSVFHAWPACSSSHFFKLFCSLPLLEDLDMRGIMADNHNDGGTISRSSTSPPLTGTLTLRLTLGTKHATLRLLELPNGLHFRKLECTWYCTNDLRCTKAVMEACSDTIECIDINCKELWGPRAGPIDFTKTIKLKEVVFRLGRLIEVWTVLALKTLTSNHSAFEKVTIHIHVWTPLAADIIEGMREEIYDQWMDLDRVLARLWESNAVSTHVVYSTKGTKKGGSEYIWRLLPEVMKRGRGMVEVVDYLDVD